MQAVSSSVANGSRECALVSDAPETRYARSVDGTNLAYQVSGEGPIDVMFLPSAGIPIDLLCDDPGFVRLRKRFETFGRTVWFDSRARGASEGDPRYALSGDVIDADLTAVLDAVGFDQAAVVGTGESGGIAIQFSAAHPDRINALVLVNSFAHYVRHDDYHWGLTSEWLDRLVAAVKERWGTGEPIEVLAPSRVADERFRSWYARAARVGGGPDQVAETIRAVMENDVRPLLNSLSVPTLVVHRERDRFIQVGAGRYLAEHIPTARFVVLPGEDHLFFVGDTDALVDEIEEFLTGARSGVEGDVLTMTVLFTDIVASTEQQTRVGPREWSRLTDRHDAMVRSALGRHGGHEVKTTGDGFLATFDATGKALRCVAEILADATNMGLHLRAGVHTGEVEVRRDDIAGLAVTIAKRVCDLAGPGQVLTSETVRSNMVGAGIPFKDQGEHELKGVPGTWRLFSAGA